MAAPVVLLLPPSEHARARRLGASFNRSLGAWTHPGHPLPRPLIRFAPEPHSPEWFDLATTTGVVLPKLSPDSSLKLRPHQKEASDLIVAAFRSTLPGFLLADEVGLGKTYSALDAVHRLSSRRSANPLNVLVLAPLSVVPHLRRSIDSYGLPNARFCVTNYESARSLLYLPSSAKQAKRTRTKNKRWASEGRSKVSWDVVIVDEAHRLKNPTSQRSYAVRQLISTNRLGKRSSPAFVLWMSATAGQNPLELAYLAPLLASRHGQTVRDLKDFEVWAQTAGLSVKRGPFGSWVWDPNPADLERMRALLFDPFRPKGAPARTRVTAALRRRPTDIAGWPELLRAPTPVALTAAQLAAYEQAWDEFCADIAAASLNSSPAGSSSGTSSGTSSRKGSTNPLVAALRFRQKASLLRTPHTAQMIVDLVTDGLRPAVSVQFYDSADAIVAALPPGLKVAVIDGRSDAATREGHRLAFQRGELDVVLFSPTEGISLHAGEAAVGGDHTTRALLVHDVRWSALEMAQIEGRTHRDGQAAVAYYLYAAHTVEERVVQAVTEKLSNMAEMMGDDTTGLDALLAAVDSPR